MVVDMDDPVVEEELRRVKKRDLFQTHLFKMGCRKFGPPKSRVRIIIAPPMQNPVPKPKSPGHSSVKSWPSPPASTVVQRFKRYPGENPVEHASWIDDRRSFRKALDGLGDLGKWFSNKPLLSDLEQRVSDRNEQESRRASPSEKPYNNTLPDTATHGVMEAGPDLRAHEPRPARRPPDPEAREERGSSTEGRSNLWSPGGRRREYLDSLARCQRRGVAVSRDVLRRALLHPGDTPLGVGSVLRQAGSGPLQVGGAPLTWTNAGIQQDENDKASLCRKTRTRLPVTRWANPDAFWPGREELVRLYLPGPGPSPASVLFQRIHGNPAPSPGNWPINKHGYSTSGAIDRHKTYVL